MRELIVNIENWVAIDSWLGAGKVTNTKSRDEYGREFAEFRAVATVICMSSELTESAVEMVGRRRFYAVGACLRQLIECEYLLIWFGEEISNARKWRESDPDTIRLAFTPKKMRKLTGFPDQEYWDHCATGGHPAPVGARLLEKLDPMRSAWPFSAAELTVDLGLHIRRIWKATDSLLAKHHARYSSVRARERAQADDAWSSWRHNDPIVQMLLGADE